jgi:hypothetical protein
LELGVPSLGNAYVNDLSKCANMKQVSTSSWLVQTASLQKTADKPTIHGYYALLLPLAMRMTLWNYV